MKAQQIAEAWNHFQEIEPDISTERLLMMVCDKCDCEDISEVVDGLIEAGILEEQ